MWKKNRKVAKKITHVLTSNEKEDIAKQSYLGKKGYTIPKACLSEAELNHLKEELKVSPEVQGPQYGVPQDNSSFPVYRENDKKIYIPRFYGIERYGSPSRSEITPGEPIDVAFTKPLRDYQENIVEVYRKHVTNSVCPNSSILGGGGILEVPCGRGKCLGKDTMVMMFDGSLRKVQDIVVGDRLMGDNSFSRNVVSLARGREKMYKIHHDTGYYIVNQSHILSLKCQYVTPEYQKGDIIDISVEDFLHLPSHYHGETPVLCGYRVPIRFHSQEANDPYSTSRFAKAPIPNNYIKNSMEVRMEVLAGFIDASGVNCKHYYELWTESADMAIQMVYLARSMGLACYQTRIENFARWKLELFGPLLENIPVKSINRVFPCKIGSDHLSYVIKVEEMGVDDYYGFEIDGNRRFVLGDFTVTHNTVMALKIISILQQKTLIIVHKEFLMNQWIDRAEEFLPGVKIGKIQGGVFDIEGKDIVLGMLQTLYDRAFPENAFDSFGLTIVDEVHRIGSVQFSKTLLRTITPNMLGISATVDRKDKLTKVLYMFIGPKIYSEDREDDDPVCVRALEYISSDPSFNETEYDFRGQAKYSTMISKLSEFTRRSEFIVKVLADLIAESALKESNAQIMLLSHNRSLLKYLHEAIVHRNFATVGYYVGGMKQSTLQETEGKQIVLATYAMAAEALDIKSLSVLVMATPKTDITQSVGRILRVRHDNPIVVDIVDRHDIFQNQWHQRRRFYKKCNYRILYKDSTQYTTMSCDWATDKTWKVVFTPFQKGGIKTSDKEERKCLISIKDL
jgi:superfamily II DNA or RNA helicase